MSKSRYTPMDRLSVQLWLARAALATARLMLKRPEHRARVDEWVADIEAFRAAVEKRDVSANWRPVEERAR